MNIFISFILINKLQYLLNDPRVYIFQYLEFLVNEIQAFRPPQEVKLRHANILLLGPVGAGKSSFFNTISSVFRGHVTRQANCGSAEKSITSKVTAFLDLLLIQRLMEKCSFEHLQNVSIKKYLKLATWMQKKLG